MELDGRITGGGTLEIAFQFKGTLLPKVVNVWEGGKLSLSVFPFSPGRLSV